MKLRIKLGLIDTKEVNWWNEIDRFPKLIKYLGRNFEWVFYDQDPAGKVDYILTFSEVPSYDPNYGVDCKTWHDYFGEDPGNYNSCECGSKYDRHSPNGHMSFCKLFRKEF